MALARGCKRERVKYFGNLRMGRGREIFGTV
jgi:hypothetical protein